MCKLKGGLKLCFGIRLHRMIMDSNIRDEGKRNRDSLVSEQLILGSIIFLHPNNKPNISEISHWELLYMENHS